MEAFPVPSVSENIGDEEKKKNLLRHMKNLKKKLRSILEFIYIRNLCAYIQGEESFLLRKNPRIK